MSNSKDEYFGTLGGSLMKDLLADLQVDDNDFSLEQLEKELLSLDQEPNLETYSQSNLLNPASLVVSHDQNRSADIPLTTSFLLNENLVTEASAQSTAPPGLAESTPATDAWSLSFQKFTSLSLQDDFLAADSARKQDEAKVIPSQEFFSIMGVEDYDVKEKPTLRPPPGLVNSSAIGLGPVDTLNVNKEPLLVTNQPISTQSVPSSVGQTLSQKKSDNNVVPKPNTVPVPEPNPIPFSQPRQGNVVQSASQGVAPIALPMQIPISMSGSSHPMVGKPVTTPITGVVVGTPVMPPPPAGQVWQTPQVQIAQQSHHSNLKLFCNPYPAAPPIPAKNLASSYMKGRDIAYVVHAILKPVLNAGISQDDYYLQYIKRRIGGPQVNPLNPLRSRDLNHDRMSRETKSKEWASGKSVLGHVTKSNVARPRALIATPQKTKLSEEDNSEQKQRANLWKSRIYCDQAYQSFQKVVDLWSSYPPGSGIPPQVQLHLVKLMKCLGILLVLDKESKVYTVNSETLKLFVKLGKGKTLLSRVLELSLLPPYAAQALLPVLLKVVTAARTSIQESNASDVARNNGSDFTVEDPSMERLFRAIKDLITKLVISDTTLLECLQVSLRNGKTAFSTQARMQCLHSLLQKGGAIIPHASSDIIQKEWRDAERQFLLLIRSA